MKKTILQTHIDLLNECRRQNKMLEKLIELNMNDLHEIADQRDWYCEEYRKMKIQKEEEIPTSFLEALNEVKDKEIKELKFKVEQLQIGHNRYEKLRRLNLQEMKELYLKHLHSLEHFDTLVDKLS